MTEGAFAATAARLAGLAGALLGWRPHEFWAATPAELTCILETLAPAPPPAPPDLDALMRRFPDALPD